ncbi:MAG: hypothetical protein ACKVOE_09340 [Rickettsiales bacterium]
MFKGAIPELKAFDDAVARKSFSQIRLTTDKGKPVIEVFDGDTLLGRLTGTTEAIPSDRCRLGFSIHNPTATPHVALWPEGWVAIYHDGTYSVPAAEMIIEGPGVLVEISYDHSFFIDRLAA